ncbi:MAG: hypothetical protein U0791_14080 [Gemmataceae bacterium]
MFAHSLLLLVGLSAPAEPPAAPAIEIGNLPAEPPAAASKAAEHPVYQGTPLTTMTEATRRNFESDKAFEGFVNPVSNPVFAKDPRSNTWARFLFINNNFPGSHPFGGGDAQVYALQVNVALTERLTFIADKDGYADIKPQRGAATNGWLNLAAGLKYTLVRDVENQFLFTAGLMYEIPTGEADALQGHGSGVLTPFVTYGKQFGEHWHLIGNHGYSFGLDQTQNSSFFYHSLHIDREIGGWFYPLAEFNWFQYTGGGDRLPRVIGEGDGLLNLGTQGMQGRQWFTTAIGAKIKFSSHLYAGAAYEFPLSDYKGILNNRVTFDMVLRY